MYKSNVHCYIVKGLYRIIRVQGGGGVNNRTTGFLTNMVSIVSLLF